MLYFNIALTSFLVKCQIIKSMYTFILTTTVLNIFISILISTDCPRAIGLTAVENNDLTKYNLKIVPFPTPIASNKMYRVQVRKNGILMLPRIVAFRIMEAEFYVDVQRLNTCQFKYTFKVIDVQCDISSGEQDEDFYLPSMSIIFLVWS